MVTFLGIAGKISEKDINEKAIKESEMIFLEGYLWDEGEPKSAFNKAMYYLIKKQCLYRINFVWRDIKIAF